MAEPGLHKLDRTHPDELCARRGLALEDPAVAEMAAGADAPAFLRWLVEEARHVDAIRYLAHALPPREGVWWACVSARRALGREPSEADAAALGAAEAWVFEPSEPRRRAALRAAQATDMQSAASLAAVAVFFSGGSVAPEGGPEEPPGEHLCPTMVASAVLYAGARGAEERAPERYRLLLAMGMDIAGGGSGRDA